MANIWIRGWQGFEVSRVDIANLAAPIQYDEARILGLREIVLRPKRTLCDAQHLVAGRGTSARPSKVLLLWAGRASTPSRGITHARYLGYRAGGGTTSLPGPVLQEKDVDALFGIEASTRKGQVRKATLKLDSTIIFGCFVVAF